MGDHLSVRGRKREQAPPEPQEEAAPDPEEESAPQPEEDESTPEPVSSTDGGKDVGEPDTGSGLRPEQLTISIFLVVVVVLGALLAVAYVRR